MIGLLVPLNTAFITSVSLSSGFKGQNMKLFCELSLIEGFV
jgi:hypothetical protein